MMMIAGSTRHVPTHLWDVLTALLIIMSALIDQPEREMAKNYAYNPKYELSYPNVF